MLVELIPLAHAGAPEPLAQRLIEHSHVIANADSVVIARLDVGQKSLQSIAHYGLLESHWERIAGAILEIIERDSRSARDPVFCLDSCDGRQRQTDLGFASLALLPLPDQDGQPRYLFFGSQRKQAFATPRAAELMTLARVVGLLLETAELKVKQQGSAAALQKADSELAALYNALKVLAPLARGDSPQQVADRLVKQLVLASDCDGVLIRNFDRQKNVLGVLALRGFSVSAAANLFTDQPDASSLQVCEEGQEIFCNDLVHDSRVELSRQSAIGWRSCALLPLRGKDEVRGVVHLGSRQLDFFPEGKRKYLAALANFCGIVLENCELLHASVRYADELKTSNGELERFAYVASHDLQEPLRMVTAYSQLLAKRYAHQLDATAGEYIACAVEGAKRMQALINDLLTFSRLNADQMPLAPVDCEAVLADVTQDMRVAIDESGVQVSCDRLPRVMADRGQLAQLFLNLISNGIKYRSPDRPKIHVSCLRQGARWLFSVADNGIGIEPEYAEKIFVIFQRLHTWDQYQGTGIGLAICKKIAERHGGKIWVESQPGKGSRFFFTLADAEAKHV